MSDLHSKIMNIQIPDDILCSLNNADEEYGYKAGHTDARHAAAELALEAKQAEFQRGIEHCIDTLIDEGFCFCQFLESAEARKVLLSELFSAEVGDE